MPSPDLKPQLKIFEKFVDNLKEYPLLQITLAGLVVFMTALFLDIEKLKEFKWLFYGVILVPLTLHCLSHLLSSFGRTEHSAKANSQVPQQSQNPSFNDEAQESGFGGKAITSLVLLIILVVGYNDSDMEDFADSETAITFLMISIAALVFSILAYRDTVKINGNRKGFVVTEIVLSSIFALASYGWLIQSGDDIYPAPSFSDPAVTNQYNAPADAVGYFCCDNWGNERCALAMPLQAGAQCSCPGQGLGYTC